MFEHALVGIDFSPAAEPLIGCLPDLKRWGVRRVTLVHVVVVGYAQGASAAYRDEFEALLHSRADDLRQAGFDVSVKVLVSSVPSQAILDAARQDGADLVVIGSRSRTLVHRIFLGSTALDTLRRTALPVLLMRIEPTGEETAAACRTVCEHTLRSILLATDRSTQARGAEAATGHLGGKADRVTLLTVLTTEDAASSQAAEADAAGYLVRVSESVKVASKTGERRVEAGAAAATIIRVAQEVEATLIVLGKNGRGWLHNVVLGSTAEAVCRDAVRPVLVVPGLTSA